MGEAVAHRATGTRGALQQAPHARPIFHDISLDKNPGRRGPASIGNEQ
jgi:hypothetical protein